MDTLKRCQKISQDDVEFFMPNCLIHEESPYLLQHAHNPVDWHAWGPKAFEMARHQDKPIFLSVGYATCHWCHVMERESFENESCARHLNETFVAIKVDREERPDIDAVFMTACQMLTGSGGWPLTIIMTPDLRPFFAGTYIPPENRMGRLGLMELCQRIGSVWREDRAKVLASSSDVLGLLDGAFQFTTGDLDAGAVLDAAGRAIARGYDPQYGGFDRAPKFPMPHRLMFLLRRLVHNGSEGDEVMIVKTLKAMRLGGIWDHVGFGFHRYSTDKRWLLPHFEKMLYDQALLAMAYLEAFERRADPLLRRTAEEIFSYVLRDMTAEEGGFFSAEDADSEGEEGRFYVWSTSELKQIFDQETARRWARILRLTDEGNFKDEASGQRVGTNIVHLDRPLETWAATLGTTAAELQTQWERVRRKMFEVRERRVHPLKDDKILTDWNGLMIAALAMGGRILETNDYTLAAERAAAFVDQRLRTPSGELLHRYRNGPAAIAAFGTDYAYLCWGLIELFRTTGMQNHLEQAVRLQRRLDDQFWDETAGGYFLTAADAEKLPVRPKELYDGALPSPNSVVLNNLAVLGEVTGEARWLERADKLVHAFGGSVEKHPTAFTHFLSGLYRLTQLAPSGKDE
jgi:uncharacterized protein YyaL (SSP411 family)